jgi:hypothetical protein
MGYIIIVTRLNILGLVGWSPTRIEKEVFLKIAALSINLNALEGSIQPVLGLKNQYRLYCHQQQSNYLDLCLIINIMFIYLEYDN